MSIYAISILGTPSNQVTFNDDNADGTYFRVRERAPQSREIRESDLPLPFESGISDWRTLVGKTAYVIQGTMYPDDEDSSDLGIRKLRKLASLDIEQADTDSDMGYVPYKWGEVGGNQLQIFLKVLYVKILESTRRGIVQDFQLVCKIKDPTVYSVSVDTASSQGIDPTIIGGTAVYPFAYPIIYGSSQYSVTKSLTNHGDMPTYPKSIQIVGPINNPIITNSLTGEFIRIGVNLNTSSNVLRISYGKDFNNIELDGISVLQNVSEDSTFFKIHPGVNPLALVGDTVGSGSYFIATCLDAYPLS